MIDATVLADALAEAGIGKKTATGYDPSGYQDMDAKTFITDWRVAGKVLESMEPHKIGLLVLNHGSNNDCPGYSMFHNPRAIIEAWYAAQETDK